MSRADDVADAGVTVLAAAGMRGLTHRAVDAAAGLPVGSTSNCFRTRADLVAGVVQRLEALDLSALTDSGPPDISTARALAEDLAARTATLSRPPHDRSVRARLALLSSGVDLHEPHHRFLALLEDALRRLGHGEPAATARAVSDLLEGALVHSATSRSRAIDADELAMFVQRLIERR